MERLLTLIFLITMFGINTSMAQVSWVDFCPEADLSVKNIEIVGSDITFDIYIAQSTSSACGTINLGHADFILDYNAAAFTAPTLTIVDENPITSNGFNVQTGYFRASPTDVSGLNEPFMRQNHYNNTSVTILNDQIVINLNGPSPTTQNAFDTGVGIIGTTEVSFGKFSISGYDGTSAHDFTWSFLTSAQFQGQALSTQMFATENGDIDPSNPEFESVAVQINTAVVLDLELTQFEASALNVTDAIVKWQTILEENLSHFVVQRSANGSDWSDVTRVDANGNSTTAIPYSYLDEDVYREGSGKTTYYYRLKSYNNDGSFNYSEIDVVVFNSKLNESEIAILPNPAQNQFVIAVNATEADVEGIIYELVDVSGRIVGQGRMVGAQTKVDVQGLAAGLYIVNFTKDDVRSFDSQKLVITGQ